MYVRGKDGFAFCVMCEVKGLGYGWLRPRTVAQCRY